MSRPVAAGDGGGDEVRIAGAWRVRPARSGDLAALQSLAGTDPAPPASADRLADPQERLLVAEALGTGQIDAALRLRPVIGLVQPRSWYHVGCTVHAAPALKLFHRQRTLMLGNDHTGASELAGWLWRRAGVALESQAAVLRLLVDVALLAVASDRQHHAPRLIAELPGLQDAAGQWPFWQGLGRHFYDGDPRDAQARHGDGWPGLVAALLPRHPVLVAFLPEAAQAAIAQVAPPARLMMELLEAAGLRYGHHVRVHDGGPVLEADVDMLPGVTQARSWTVQVRDAETAVAGGPGAGTHTLLGAGGVALRCTPGMAGPRLQLAPEDAQALGLADGGVVWGLAR